MQTLISSTLYDAKNAPNAPAFHRWRRALLHTPLLPLHFWALDTMNDLANIVVQVATDFFTATFVRWTVGDVRRELRRGVDVGGGLLRFSVVRDGLPAPIPSTDTYTTPTIMLPTCTPATCHFTYLFRLLPCPPASAGAC